MRSMRRSLSTLALIPFLLPAICYGTDSTPVLGTWGGFGSGPGQFKYPTGIAVDGSGNVYVADKDNYRIQKFSSEGAFITSWGSSGSGAGQFDGLSTVAVGPDGSVFTTENVNHRVQKFTSTGTYVTSWGSFGSCDGQFDSPLGIAVDDDGNVYVADEFNYRIQKFSSSGGFITKWGSWETPCWDGSDGGIRVGYVSVAANGDILVGGYTKVREFSSSGTPVREWNCCSQAFTSGIDQAGPGNIYVGNALGNRVQVFSSGGTLLSEFGSPGTGEGQFDFAGAVAATATSVYVCDLHNHRIQQFAVDSGITTIKSSTWGNLKIIYR